MIEIKLPKKYSFAESKVYKEGFLDGYTTGRKSVLDKIAASGRARWAQVSLEDRIAHARMMNARSHEAKRRKKAQEKKT